MHGFSGEIIDGTGEQVHPIRRKGILGYLPKRYWLALRIKEAREDAKENTKEQR